VPGLSRALSPTPPRYGYTLVRMMATTIITIHRMPSMSRQRPMAVFLYVNEEPICVRSVIQTALVRTAVSRASHRFK